MKKIVLLFSLAGALLLTACGPREIPAKGDFTVRVFDDTPVRFAPDIYPEAYNAPGADSIIGFRIDIRCKPYGRIVTHVR